MKKKLLYNILMQENISLSINNNLDKLLNIIPEIKDMINFPHNNPHHHLDVWNHTLLALSLSPIDFEIRLTLLLHDIGKPHSYQDLTIRHFRNHPVISAQISKKILNRLNFNDDEIANYSYLIETHDSKIKEDEIKNNYELTLKKYQIQLCDALAHNPAKLEKRIEYLLETNDILHSGTINNNYKALIKKYNKNNTNT